MINNVGETIGGVRWLLRMEGLIILVTSLLVYSRLGFSWKIFTLYFLIPDLSMLGYLVGSRFGAFSYNSAHSYIGAVSCLVYGFLTHASILLFIGLIWCAHIGFDRALGYGIKYSLGFHFTHLGKIGRFKS